MLRISVRQLRALVREAVDDESEGVEPSRAEARLAAMAPQRRAEVLSIRANQATKSARSMKKPSGGLSDRVNSWQPAYHAHKSAIRAHQRAAVAWRDVNDVIGSEEAAKEHERIARTHEKAAEKLRSTYDQIQVLHKKEESS